MKDFLKTFGVAVAALFSGLVVAVVAALRFKAKPPLPPAPPPAPVAPTLEDVPVPVVDTAPATTYEGEKVEPASDPSGVVVSLNERHK